MYEMVIEKKKLGEKFVVSNIDTVIKCSRRNFEVDLYSQLGQFKLIWIKKNCKRHHDNVA